MELTALQRKITRKYVAWVGFALLAMPAGVYALQTVSALFAERYFPDAFYSDWFLWVTMIINQYGVGFLIVRLMMRRAPAVSIPPRSMGVKRFLTLIPMCYCILFLGSLIGNGIPMIFNLFSDSAQGAAPGIPFGATLSAQPNVALDILMSALSGWGALTVCVCAPIMEELIFRKLLIDRMARYGQWTAVLVSGLLFGLYHGNLSQFFYAFGLGLAFGYIYVKKGKIWHTMLLHGIVNCIPFLIVPALRETASARGILYLMAVGSSAVCVAVLGGVLLILNRKRIRFTPRVAVLPQNGWAKYVFGNPGMIGAMAGCAATFVLFYVPALPW